jgi:hypothetical protein
LQPEQESFQTGAQLQTQRRLKAEKLKANEKVRHIFANMGDDKIIREEMRC